MKREFRYTRRIGIEKPPKKDNRTNDIGIGLMLGVFLLVTIFGFVLIAITQS